MEVLEAIKKLYAVSDGKSSASEADVGVDMMFAHPSGL